MGKSAGHHTIPQAILRRFRFHGDAVWYFSKHIPADGVHRRNISNVFKRRHYNSIKLVSGETDDRLERFYGEKLDADIGRELDQIERIILHGEAYASVNKTFLVQYLYNLVLRSPEFHKVGKIEEELHRVATDLFGDELKAREGIANLFTGKKLERYLHNIRVQTTAKQSESVLNHMADLSLVFGVPDDSRKSFIIGSTPMSRFTNDGDTDLRTGQVELWWSLDPKFAVGLVRNAPDGKIIRLTSANVRKLNECTVKDSVCVASKSDKLLSSLVRRHCR